MKNKNIDKSWSEFFDFETKKDYFENIRLQILKDINSGEIVYPELNNVFYAFEKTPLSSLKVVILGQDPYHGKGQAHGLSFSVNDSVKFPKSLSNIFKELEDDLGIKKPQSGNLTQWAESGVLLLNSILTVKSLEPASHSKIGWEIFSDNVIKYISDKKENIIFILWGNFAKNKKKLINGEKHFIIESTHPSPFSAYNGFFGSKPFSKTNKILNRLGKSEIDWNLNKGDL